MSFKWKTSQPNLGDEIIVWINSPSSPSFHSCIWQPDSNRTHYSNDWDIEILPRVYVGPRNFEGGCQFLKDIKSKEFYWVHKKDFLNFVGIKENKEV